MERDFSITTAENFFLSALAIRRYPLTDSRYGAAVNEDTEIRTGPMLALRVDPPEEFQDRVYVLEILGSLSYSGFSLFPLDLKFGLAGTREKVVTAAKRDSRYGLLGAIKRRQRRLDPGLDERHRRNAASAAGPPAVFGVEFGDRDLAALMRQVLDADWIDDVVAAVASAGTFKVGFIASATEVSAALTPELLPNLAILRALPVVPAGLTFVVMWAPPATCDNLACSFIKTHWGNPTAALFANIDPVNARVGVGMALSDIYLSYDSCGRPFFELASVGMFIAASAAGVSLGFQVMLTLDVGNMRRAEQSDFCSLAQYTVGQPYRYFEPLTFAAELDVSATSIAVTGAMIGTYTKAFGINALHVSDLLLSLKLTAALGFPGFEAGGTLDFGLDCWVPDAANGGLGLVRNTAAACVGASVYVGLDPANALNNYMAAEFRGGLTLQAIIKAFGAPAEVANIVAALPKIVRTSGYPAPSNNQSNPRFSFAANPGGKSLPGRYIPGGVVFDGLLDVLGLQALANISVNPLVGVRARVMLPPLSLAGGALKLQRSSADAAQGPLLDINATYVPLTFGVHIEGLVSVMGLQVYTQLVIDDSYMQIALQGKIFDAFQATLVVRATYGDLLSAGFHVSGQLQADFASYMTNGITALVQGKADSAVERLLAAQQTLDSANAALGAAQDRFNQAQARKLDADSEVARLTETVSQLQAQEDAYGNAATQLASAKTQLAAAQAVQASAATDLQGNQTALDAAVAQQQTAVSQYQAAQADNTVRGGLAALRVGVGLVFTLHSAQFNVSVPLAGTGAFTCMLDFTFFGKRETLGVTVNFMGAADAVKTLFDLIFTPETLQALDISTKQLGEACTAHHNCIGWGPGLNDVACCSSKCTRKIADWAKVGYCPAECVGLPGGAPGSCGLLGFPRALGEACNLHTDCQGYGPNPTDVACCTAVNSVTSVCTAKVKDFAGVGYCPAECRGGLFDAPGTCNSGLSYPRALGQSCALAVECANWDSSTQATGCCSGTCQELKKDYLGAWFCSSECRACPPTLCGLGTCGIEPWPRTSGYSCVFETDCASGLSCCSDGSSVNKCFAKISDWAGIPQCPAACYGCAPWVPGCESAGTCQC